MTKNSFKPAVVKQSCARKLCQNNSIRQVEGRRMLTTPIAKANAPRKAVLIKITASKYFGMRPRMKAVAAKPRKSKYRGPIGRIKPSLRTHCMTRPNTDYWLAPSAYCSKPMFRQLTKASHGCDDNFCASMKDGSSKAAYRSCSQCGNHESYSNTTTRRVNLLFDAEMKDESHCDDCHCVTCDYETGESAGCNACKCF